MIEGLEKFGFAVTVESLMGGKLTRVVVTSPGGFKGLGVMESESDALSEALFQLAFGLEGALHLALKGVSR